MLRAAFPEDHRGDALADEALRVAIAEERVVRVVVNIDEAGRDDQARCVDGALRGFAGELADGGDAVAGKGEVGDVAGVARAVGDTAVADEDVVVLGEEWKGGENGKEGAAHSGHYTAGQSSPAKVPMWPENLSVPAETRRREILIVDSTNIQA